MSTQATHHDADLILKLYELRREPVMREARSYVGGFSPKSVDDLIAATSAGAKENAYFRQVMGYWEMAATLVLRGALNHDLAMDNYGEMFFVYAKVQPFLDEYREKMNMPQVLRHVQKLIESVPDGAERVARMQKQQAEMAKRMAAAK